eukprot:m.57982 g.57982  ORF g.57982 m.57982 type:complete len:547 (+) comp11145_c0_seq3:238-1878(+)
MWKPVTVAGETNANQQNGFSRGLSFKLDKAQRTRIKGQHTFSQERKENGRNKNITDEYQGKTREAPAFEPIVKRETKRFRGPFYRPTPTITNALLKTPTNTSQEDRDKLLECFHAQLQGCNKAEERILQKPNYDSEVEACEPEGISSKEVAILLLLYQHGWGIMHPYDTRHCPSVLPYDKGALKFLQCIDAGVIPSQLINLVSELGPGICNDCVTVEIRDYRATYIDMSASREKGSLRPSVRRVRLFATGVTRLMSLHHLSREAQKSGITLKEADLVRIEKELLPQRPLCLDPSVGVFWVSLVTHATRNKWKLVSKQGFKRQLSQKVQSKSSQAETEQEVKNVSMNKKEYSSLVNFLTGGKSTRIHRDWRRANDAGKVQSAKQEEMPGPPPSINVVAGGHKGARISREMEFSSNYAATSAFSYNTLAVEVRKDNPSDLWHVCVRSSKDPPFKPELCYVFNSGHEAHGFCDELRKVETAKEKRVLTFDRPGGPKKTQPQPVPKPAVAQMEPKQKISSGPTVEPMGIEDIETELFDDVLKHFMPPEPL